MGSIADKAYKKYQLAWMMSHNLGIDDICLVAGEWYSDKFYGDECSFSEYLYDNGFNGSIYACREEFMGAEYLDKEYMKVLLTEEEYKIYLREVEENELSAL